MLRSNSKSLLGIHVVSPEEEKERLRGKDLQKWKVSSLEWKSKRDVVKFISDYCIKYGRSNSCIGKNVMFCMQRYKCSVEMVFSDQMNIIIECDFIRSTDCMHAALANLLFELIMVRDGVLLLPTWFSRDLIDDVLSSVCV